MRVPDPDSNPTTNAKTTKYRLAMASYPHLTHVVAPAAAGSEKNCPFETGDLRLRNHACICDCGVFPQPKLVTGLARGTQKRWPIFQVGGKYFLDHATCKFR